MTDAQKRFVELEKRKTEWKTYLDELTEATQAVADEVGIGNYFQDEEATVYKVVVPQGKWVVFPTIGYLRTKREGEERGTLSIKEAREQGFNPENPIPDF